MPVAAAVPVAVVSDSDSRCLTASDSATVQWQSVAASVVHSGNGCSISHNSALMYTIRETSANKNKLYDYVSKMFGATVQCVHCLP